MAEKKINEKNEDKEKRSVKIGRASDFAMLYADGVRLSVGAYDIKLTFSMNEVMFNNDVVITEVATVILSPLHAKELAEKLTVNVKRYEEDFMSLEVREEHEMRKRRDIKTIIEQNP